MPERPPHPDDCRTMLRALGAQRTAFLRWQAEWPSEVAECARMSQAAGLSLTEVASLVGVARTTIYAALDAHPVGETERSHDSSSVVGT